MRKIFDNLIGKWQIKRFIKNNNQIQGSGEGLAIIVLKNPTYLFYREDLKVQFTDGKLINAYREYYYFYDEKDELITKKFIDGTKFYDFEFNSNNSQVTGTHQCKEDIYLAKYKFKNNNFLLEYKIIGPAKNLIISTIYTKI